MFFKFNLLFELWTFQIIYRGQDEHTRHNLWYLLNVNFKNKSFHNSADCQGIHLQVYIFSRYGKMFRFTIFKLREKDIFETPTLLLWSDYWSPMQKCRTAPFTNLALKKNVSYLRLSCSLLFYANFEKLWVKLTSGSIYMEKEYHF